MPDQKNALDAKFDYLRLCMAIFVVAIHAMLFPRVLYPWLRIAVPMFFMLSAYFLFGKMKQKDEQEQKKVLKSFSLRNFKLYAFWFVLLLPITLYVRRSQYFGAGVLRGVFAFIRSVFFGSTFVASWYIAALVIGTLIIWYLSKRMKGPWLLALCLATNFIAVLTSSYTSVLFQVPAMEKICAVYENLLGSAKTNFFVALIWIYVGKLFAEEKIRLPEKGVWKAVIFLISCAALYLEWRLVVGLSGIYSNDCYFMLLPVCISLFAIIKEMKVITSKYSVRIRRLSTFMYALHGSLIYVVQFASEIVFAKKPPVPVFLATLLLCAAGYVLVEYIIEKAGANKPTKLLKNAY